jgi:large subunit ribosomal protein L10
MKRAEKPLFVQNLAEELKSSTAIVVINYQGLSVKLQQELKKRLKNVEAKMLVVKNTLFRLASNEAKMPEEIISDTVLSGPCAIVITEGDPIAPLQVLAKFASEFEIPQFKVGIVEGQFQDKEKLIALSKLPPKNILFAQLLGTLMGIPYGFVGTLQGNLQKLVYILDQKSKTADNK